MTSTSVDEDDRAALTCSWLAECEGPMPPFVHILASEAGAMEAAESAMTAGMASSTCELAEGVALLSSPTGTAAPYICLAPSSSAIVALCVASNARLLEIHAGAGHTTGPPLATCEASDGGAGGWRTHYLVSSATDPLDTPLLPASTTGYTIKFFARRPASVLKVACFCVVRGAAEATSRAPTSSATHTQSGSDAPAATAATGSVMADEQSALVQHLTRMESQMTVMMQLILRRLDKLEARVSALDGQE